MLGIVLFNASGEAVKACEGKAYDIQVRQCGQHYALFAHYYHRLLFKVLSSAVWSWELTNSPR